LKLVLHLLSIPKVVDKISDNWRIGLDNYIYSVKSSLNDPEKLKGKISKDDEDTLEDAIKEGQSFLDSNPDAEK
jgi:molecular chaperone DnaK (HSP70)